MHRQSTRRPQAVQSWTTGRPIIGVHKPSYSGPIPSTPRPLGDGASSTKIGPFLFSVHQSPLLVRPVAAACPSAVDCGSLFFPFHARLVFLPIWLTADTDAVVPRSPRHTATVAAGSRDPPRRDGERLQLVTREPGSGGWPWHHSLPPPAARLPALNDQPDQVRRVQTQRAWGAPPPRSSPLSDGCTVLYIFVHPLWRWRAQGRRWLPLTGRPRRVEGRLTGSATTRP